MPMNFSTEDLYQKFSGRHGSPEYRLTVVYTVLKGVTPQLSMFVEQFGLTSVQKSPRKVTVQIGVLLKSVKGKTCFSKLQMNICL